MRSKVFQRILDNPWYYKIPVLSDLVFQAELKYKRLKEKFEWMGVYFSPFKAPIPKFYVGKIAVGVPYFYPRRWVKATPKRATEAALKEIKRFEAWNEANKGKPRRIPSFEEVYKDKLNYQYIVDKKIGFDFVGLGYKTKWSDTDYRFEWGPIWSFVFFGWQVAVSFKVPYPEHYWVCWLTYKNDTYKQSSTRMKIHKAKEVNPEVWTSSFSGLDNKKETVCYWDKVLKDKWL